MDGEPEPTSCRAPADAVDGVLNRRGIHDLGMSERCVRWLGTLAHFSRAQAATDAGCSVVDGILTSLRGADWRPAVFRANLLVPLGAGDLSVGRRPAEPAHICRDRPGCVDEHQTIPGFADALLCAEQAVVSALADRCHNRRLFLAGHRRAWLGVLYCMVERRRLGHVGRSRLQRFLVWFPRAADRPPGAGVATDSDRDAPGPGLAYLARGVGRRTGNLLGGPET